MHNSQVEAVIRLHKSQVKLVCILIEKAVSTLVDKYAKDNAILVKGLEIMKNKSNILSFIFLSKVSIIQNR